MPSWRLPPLLLLVAAGMLAPVLPAPATALGAQVVGPRAAARTVGVTPQAVQHAALTERRDLTAAAATQRSRTRGARNGFLVGALVGVVAGVAISGDFYNDPAVNVAIGAAAFGLLGALVGAAVGARVPPA